MQNTLQDIIEYKRFEQAITKDTRGYFGFLKTRGIKGFNICVSTRKSFEGGKGYEYLYEPDLQDIAYDTAHEGDDTVVCPACLEHISSDAHFYRCEFLPVLRTVPGIGGEAMESIYEVKDGYSRAKVKKLLAAVGIVHKPEMDEVDG